MSVLENISKVYFLGVGGIGMSALARYFNERGLEVKGYDKTPSPLTDQLSKEGIQISFDDELTTLMQDADLVVYTPAIPVSHKQLNWYKEHNYQLMKRSEVLGLISRNHFCIAIAGSHGKTTVSSMLAHLLNQSEGCTAFLGGIATNYNSNYIHSSDKYMVVEADEFDRSFLTLHPNIAGITAIDSDHLEVYGSLEKIEEEFIQFANQIVADGKLVIHEDYSHVGSLIKTDIEQTVYGQRNQADYRLLDYRIEGGRFIFSVDYKGEKIANLEANFGGIHNLENATLAIAIAKNIGLDNDSIKDGIRSFKGIKRRFEKHVDGDTIYIDDYAHHPMEIRAFLNSLKYLYPDKEILAIFQPHLFSRTQNLYQEFGDELSVADQVFLLPIYPAREEPVEGVSSELIWSTISHENKGLVEKEELLNLVQKHGKGKVVATIGAGDIDRFVEPIKTLFGEKGN